MKKIIPIMLSIIIASITASAQSPAGSTWQGTSAGVTVTLISSCTISFAASCNISVSAGLSSGGVVIVGSGNGAGGTITATDNASTPNTYTTDEDFFANGNLVGFIHTTITHVIPTSGHITVSDSTGGSDQNTWYAFAVSTLSTIDQHTHNSVAFGKTWSTGTTAATTNATDVVFGAWVAGATNTVTFSPTCTALETANLSLSRYIWICWRSTVSTGTQNETGTATTNDDPAAAISAYEQ